MRSHVLGAGNPRVVDLRRLVGRKGPRSGQVLIEGPRAIAEALEAGLVLRTVVVAESGESVPAVTDVLARLGVRGGDLVPRTHPGAASDGHPTAVPGRNLVSRRRSFGAASGADPSGSEADGVEVLVVRDHVFSKLAPSVTPQPMIALVERPSASLPTAVDDDDLWAVLVGLGDPGNVGTLIRSAAAFGAAGVVVSGGADPWGPKAVRASAGSVLRVPVVSDHDARTALRALSDAGATIIGTGADRGIPHDQGVLRPPVAIVLGSESHGLDRSIVGLVDVWCHIGMPGGTESLNVAMAGTLLLHEASLHRSGEDRLSR